MGRAEGGGPSLDHRNSTGVAEFEHVEAPVMMPVDYKDADIVIVGLARSGAAAARLLEAAGARVTVADRKEPSELGGVLSQLNQERIRTALGPGYESALEG